MVGASITGARYDAAYRPRLEDVSRGIRDNNDVPVIAPELVNGLFLKTWLYVWVGNAP